ncbi:MAG: helix-turn-helix transcriptional regulator [Verrucomicrobia bacterium]|nr:helix-turn-helix transcriptional regulator [Verrucomicrobiota bacterium]
MPAAPDFLEFHTIYSSPIVTVSNFCCRANRSGPGEEELSEANRVVLMRRGAFSKHLGRKKITADVNQALFFAKDAVYRVSHPVDCGDCGTIFTLAPRNLNDIVRARDPSIDEHPDRPFQFVTGPCDVKIYWRHHLLARQLESQREHPIEHFWADETTLQLVADVLEFAFDRQGSSRETPRITTDADHAEKTEAAKELLAARMSERVMLDEIAREVGASPFNFARLFRRQTGLPVHRYLTLLRLGASLERLAESNVDLTILALELGFSSHSHFTDVFRHEFGETPSSFRRKASRKSIGEISRNLIARRSTGDR